MIVESTFSQISFVMTWNLEIVLANDYRMDNNRQPYNIVLVYLWPMIQSYQIAQCPAQSLIDLFREHQRFVTYCMLWLLSISRGDCQRPCFDQLKAQILERQQNSKRSKMCAFSWSKHGRLQSPLGLYELYFVWKIPFPHTLPIRDLSCHCVYITLLLL